MSSVLEIKSFELLQNIWSLKNGYIFKERLHSFLLHCSNIFLLFHYCLQRLRRNDILIFISPLISLSLCIALKTLAQLYLSYG